MQNFAVVIWRIASSLHQGHVSWRPRRRLTRLIEFVSSLVVFDLESQKVVDRIQSVVIPG